MNEAPLPYVNREACTAEPLYAADRGALTRSFRCRLARSADSGPGLTSETSRLLRTRLRLAILIILSAFVLHFLRNLLQSGPGLDQRPLWLFFSGCEILAMSIVSGLLWSRRPLGIKTLRLLELTIFGAVAAYIAGLQVVSYHDGFLARAVVEGKKEASIGCWESSRCCVGVF